MNDLATKSKEKNLSNTSSGYTLEQLQQEGEKIENECSKLNTQSDNEMAKLRNGRKESPEFSNYQARKKKYLTYKFSELSIPTADGSFNKIQEVRGQLFENFKDRANKYIGKDQHWWKKNKNEILKNAKDTTTKLFEIHNSKVNPYLERILTESEEGGLLKFPKKETNSPSNAIKSSPSVQEKGSPTTLSNPKNTEEETSSPSKNAIKSSPSVQEKSSLTTLSNPKATDIKSQQAKRVNNSSSSGNSSSGNAILNGVHNYAQDEMKEGAIKLVGKVTGASEEATNFALNTYKPKSHTARVQQNVRIFKNIMNVLKKIFELRIH